MEAKKALRSYRGPADPLPFMGIINSLSFQCRNMERLSPAIITRLKRDMPWGSVEVTRVGAMANENTGMEFVKTTGTVVGDVIILGEDISGLSTGVRIYDATNGLLLKKISTLINGPITSADSKSFHKYCFTDRFTPSYYAKWSYLGAQKSGVTFAAGTVNFATGYLAYDLISGWLYPDPAEPGGNTQSLWLYKDDAYVNGVSFNRTDAHVTMATGVAITKDGVYVTMIDYDIVANVITNLVNFMNRYDLTMTLIAQTAPESVYPSLAMVQNPKGNAKFITYTYDLGGDAWCLLPSLAGPYKFAIDSGAGFFSPLGVIKGVYFIWRRPYSVDKTITIIAYDLANAGAEKYRLTINAAAPQLDIWRGVTAEQVKLW